MRPDKNLEKLLFEMLKKQYVTCSKGDCDRCYENKMGSCSTAMTAQEISYELMENGYGNLKEAVKEFADELKQLLMASDFVDSEYWACAHKVDEMFEILYGEEK